ncbi:MAG TPA: hypothetical protein VNF68_15130 [Candidatus Baltobacteraceae bacterium]|nr:hypothetical protein [Candidatus Baltobacteraceae bacterium]
MEQGIQEALIATSAASAVLWTGGLIVTQLTDSRHGDSQRQRIAQGPVPWLYVQFPLRPRSQDLRTTSEVLSVASLAMLGFGIIAPICGLFLSGLWLRVTALIFVGIYSKSTWVEATFAIRLLRGKDQLRADTPNRALYKKTILWYIAQEVAQFTAMVAVVAFPITKLLLILSIAFMFVGYQGVLGRYLINRRPFEP